MYQLHLVLIVLALAFWVLAAAGKPTRDVALLLVILDRLIVLLGA